jgi:hypothetical protein
MLLSLLRQGPDVVDTDLSKYFGTSKHILAKRHVCQITGVQAREPEAEAALPVRVAQPLRPLPAPSTMKQSRVRRVRLRVPITLEMPKTSCAR